MERGSLRPIITQLEDIFKACNERFFDGELQRPVIAVNSDSTNSSYGWVTTWKSWQEVDGDGYYEINICAESLNRSVEDLIATMLHEMVHLWNLQIGVKDTSRGNAYHNKAFKKEAEQRGLTIERDSKYGWTITTLNEDGNAFAELFKDFEFALYRTPLEKSASTTTRKSSSRKYVCSECGAIVRATKEINILCGECTTEDNLVRMELEE